MADKGTPDDGPSLEMPALPSLPFGRKKRRDEPDQPEPIQPQPIQPQPIQPETIQPETTARETSPPAPAGPPAAAAPAPSTSAQRPTQVLPPSPAPSRAPQPQPQPQPPQSSRRRPTLPALSGVAAALATGAAVGALGVLLVWLASVGCEAARGTASCGDGPGFLVLVAVLALLAYLGAMALRAFGVADAGSTSLLAVGVMAVLLLVLFTDALFEWWMALVVPAVSALAYALAWWISTRAVPVDQDDAPARL